MLVSGIRFGRLVTVNYQGKDMKGHTNLWKCICDCGNSIVTRETTLKRGETISCGCYSIEKLKERSTIHGLSNHRLYKIYKSMKQRCCNVNSRRYHDYGGRGIKICNEWLNDFNKFYNWAIQNGYDDNLSLERTNNEEGYNPQNCKWIPLAMQSSNRRCNHLLTFNDQTKTITEWAKDIGGNFNLVYRRLKRGWNLEKTLTTKIKEKRW